jgi:hypothetical protein
MKAENKLSPEAQMLSDDAVKIRMNGGGIFLCVVVVVVVVVVMIRGGYQPARKRGHTH